MTHGSHRFRLLSADYEPADLFPQLPREGTLIRKIAGSDRPDYWLAELDQPLAWTDNGATRSISHLVLAARYEGQTIAAPVQQLVTAIAYVVDESLLNDATLSFSKCRYVAIGEIASPSGLTHRWSGRVIDKVPSSFAGVRAAQLDRYAYIGNMYGT